MSEKSIETINWENWIKNRSNLVVIIIDSVRYDQFKESTTPNINTVTQKIQKAYSSASWTLPSMKAILYGMFPSGRDEFYFPCFSWASPLPNRLKEEGYFNCAYSGNPQFRRKSFAEMIFDKFFCDTEMELEGSGERLVKQFLKDIKIIKEPFFMVFLFVETHAPFIYLGRSYKEKLSRKELQKRGISHIDKLFKQIYDVLPINTEIYITSDHGELFKDDGYGYGGHNPRRGAIGFPELFEVFTIKIVK